jgi:hypothetical protein
MKNELLEGVLNARISLMEENSEKSASEALLESLKVIGIAAKADGPIFWSTIKPPTTACLACSGNGARGNLAANS